MKDRIQKILVVLFLGFLCLSAFYVRFNVARRTAVVSFDESVYFSMAHQVSRDWRDYSSRTYANDFLKRYPGVELPEYLFKPLYKHPPLFTFFNAAALKLSIPIEFVPIGFSILTIIVTHLLGSLIFNRAVGLVSAFFLCIDPISIITSQKLWPDTCLAFFMLAAIYFFVLGIKKEKDMFFALSGAAIGLAAVTKYPGVLPLFGIFIYGLVYKPEQLNTKRIFIILCSALLVSLPWFCWLGFVYGKFFVSENMRINNFDFTRMRTLVLIAFFVLTITSFILLSRLAGMGKRTLSRKSIFVSNVILMSILFLCVKDGFFNILNIFDVPDHFWKKSDAFCPNRCFYIRQLSEYSLLYIFGFVSIFQKDLSREKCFDLLKICAGFILIFFTIWGTYQSRYILPASPLFILLGVRTWKAALSFFTCQPDYWVRNLGRFLLVVLGTLVLCKTIYLDVSMGLSNAMFYY